MLAAGQHLGRLHHVGVDQPPGLEAPAVEVDGGRVVEDSALAPLEELDLHRRRLHLRSCTARVAKSDAEVET